MTITTDDLVRREVHYCASQLVSELYKSQFEVADWWSQAMDLCTPTPDYAEAALQNGWFQDEDGSWFREAAADDDEDDISVQPDGSRLIVEVFPEDACKRDDLDGYDYAREIFEHWIVSDWLADKLAEHGETVGKDFMGLTIWARTTTGQGIASDHVIEKIAAELNDKRNGVGFWDDKFSGVSA